MNRKKKILYADPAAAALLGARNLEQDIALVRELPQVDVVDKREDTPELKEDPATVDCPVREWTLFGVTWPRWQWVAVIGGTAAALAALAALALRRK